MSALHEVIETGRIELVEIEVEASAAVHLPATTAAVAERKRDGIAPRRLTSSAAAWLRRLTLSAAA